MRTTQKPPHNLEAGGAVKSSFMLTLKRESAEAQDDSSEASEAVGIRIARSILKEVLSDIDMGSSNDMGRESSCYRLKNWQEFNG